MKLRLHKVEDMRQGIQEETVRAMLEAGTVREVLVKGAKLLSDWLESPNTSAVGSPL